MTYSREELETIERMLLRDRDRVVRKLSRFHESSMDAAREGAFGFHMAEEGTETMEREQAVLLASEEGRRLQAIDAALRRLYTDPERFGVCSGCGEPIGFARLEAIPQAEYCIACQNRQETGRTFE